jgi:iron(III) transport system ATP-binding protein
VAVMSAGNILQLGVPSDVYHSPADLTVAGFVGRGSVVSATVVQRYTTSTLIDIAGYRLNARGEAHGASQVQVLLRPEAISFANNGLEAIVQESIYRGPVHETRVQLSNGEHLTLDSPLACGVGDKVHVAVTGAWIIP